jgi:malate dehydrogenase (oxaloacetate-decarboxylating)
VDVYIGLSNDPIKKEWIKKMNPKAIIFALSDKEISEKDATDNGAEVFMSNRSGDKNKINSSLVSPGMFRAINDQHLKQITDEMKIAIAKTIAEGVRK